MVLFIVTNSARGKWDSKWLIRSQRYVNNLVSSLPIERRHRAAAARDSHRKCLPFLTQDFNLAPERCGTSCSTPKPRPFPQAGSHWASHKDHSGAGNVRGGQFWCVTCPLCTAFGLPPMPWRWAKRDVKRNSLPLIRCFPHNLAMSSTAHEWSPSTTMWLWGWPKAQETLSFKHRSINDPKTPSWGRLNKLIQIKYSVLTFYWVNDFKGNNNSVKTTTISFHSHTIQTHINLFIFFFILIF